MKIAATVILYNPQSDLFNNLKSYTNQVEEIFVIDNSPEPDISRQEKINQIFPHMTYIANKENLGIAKGLNIACTHAIAQGYDWLLTMDQDSAFENFTDYLDCFSTLSNKNNIAITSPNISKKNVSPYTKKCSHYNADATITSGSLLNLKLFNQIGQFEEKLFIDSVDVDYCFKAKKIGLKVLFFEKIFLKHTIGTKTLCKNLFTRKLKNIKQHTPSRVYYTIRNKLYLMSQYRHDFPEICGTKKILHDIFIRKIKKVIFYEDQKFLKLYAIFKGVLHFLLKRYGSEFSC